VNITSFTYSQPPTSASSAVEGSWQTWAVANATLGYNRTQAYIHNAWNYTFNIYQSGNPSPNIFTVANIVRSLDLSVSGNWTTGYTLEYTVHTLNITVEYNPSSTYYPVLFFNTQNGSNFQGSIRFNTTQQQAISIALSNSTVRSVLSQFPYFVDAAFLFPAGNRTFGGDYLVWFFQLNGTKILGAYVNMSTGSVVSAYSVLRRTVICYSNKVCFSSPWGA
jgi:hypothetical protein